MSENQVTVIALIEAKPGCDSDVRNGLLKLAGPTRKEPGCINYDIHLSKDHSGLFMIHENWKSRQELDRHLEMPYLKGFLEETANKLAKPVEVTTWGLIG